MSVYLLHFDQPLGSEKHQAQHYLGWSPEPAIRLEQHRRGLGAAITRAANRLGITYDIVRLWPGGKAEERQLKNYKKNRKLCPVCIQENYKARLLP